MDMKDIYKVTLTHMVKGQDTASYEGLFESKDSFLEFIKGAGGYVTPYHQTIVERSVWGDLAERAWQQGYASKVDGSETFYMDVEPIGLVVL